MFRPLLSSLLILTLAGIVSAQGVSPSPKRARLLPANLHLPAGVAFDLEAEEQLLALANRARAEAGLPQLTYNENLSDAAREHAIMMAGEGQLSHQFSGELDLPQRVAAVGDIHLDQAAENVGLALSPEQAQQAFMESKPHRENLMNPAYNLAGIGVVRDGNHLYVVQDFGHGLPVYSTSDSEQKTAESVQKLREKNGLPSLRRVLNGDPESLACAMAKADSLKAGSAHGYPRYVLRFTSSDPSSLPSSASQSILDSSLRSFAIGSCYATTPTYPNGAYWTVLLLY